MSEPRTPWPEDEDPADHPEVVNLDWKESPGDFFDRLAPLIARVTAGEYELVEYDSGGDNYLFAFRRVAK
jgi:hypothetical protein